MSNLVEHAKREFEVLGWPGSDDMQRHICDNIIELLQTFADQGHSGTSANYVLKYFEKLARFDAISPLTGEDEEWFECFPGQYQNRRDSSVFKDQDGRAYWIHGKIFRDKDGSSYTNIDSRVYIEFPWVKPESIIIDVEE